MEIVILDKNVSELSWILSEFSDPVDSYEGFAEKLGLSISDEQAREVFFGGSPSVSIVTYQYTITQADTTINMSQAEANEVYNVLTSIGGANPLTRLAFLHEFIESANPATEWRFQGSLGFGGKFRYNQSDESYSIDCYREDETPEINAIISEMNVALEAVFKQWNAAV